MPLSPRDARQRCKPWPIPLWVHAECSLLATHPSKWRQNSQHLLLQVAFAQRNYLRGIAHPCAAPVNPSRVGCTDPEQVDVGTRTGWRQLPQEELVSSVPNRHTFRLVNAMDEPSDKARIKP